MEVPHSLQGHPLSGKQQMEVTDKILINDLGFSMTTHDGCTCKRTDWEGTISILQQVDDFPIGTTNQATAESHNMRKICQSHSLGQLRIATEWMSNTVQQLHFDVIQGTR